MKNIELLLHLYEYGQQIISGKEFLTGYRMLPEPECRLFRTDFMDAVIPLIGNNADKKSFNDILQEAALKYRGGYFFMQTFRNSVNSVPSDVWQAIFPKLLSFFKQLYYPLFLKSDKKEWQFRDYRSSRNKEILLRDKTYYALKDLPFCCEHFRTYAFLENQNYPNIHILFTPTLSSNLSFRQTCGYDTFDFTKTVGLMLTYCPFCGKKLSAFYKRDIRYAHEIEGVTFELNNPGSRGDRLIKDRNNRVSGIGGLSPGI